jgi:hypothetical protein
LVQNSIPSLLQLLVSARFRPIKTKLKKILIELNIFKHHGSNEHHLHYQRIATRLYILILVISLIILNFYSLLIKEIHNGTVLNPTESEYNRLEQIYSDSLSCPCTSISMNYSTFINIEPQYHQVCLSDLVSTRWINYNEHQDPVAGHAGDDYRSTASSYWQLLAMFCQESRTTVDDALRLFFQIQFVSSQVISQQLFESQVNLSIRNWQSGTIERFLRTIQLVQKMNFGNQLMSNAVDVEIDMNGDSLEFIMEAEQPGKNCSCVLSRSCRSPMRIYLDQPEFSYIDDRIVLVYIPNFFAGCSPVEDLLQSTLECFYNRSCMIDIDQYMYLHLGPSFNFSALDSTRNWPNETIQSIVNRLMIDSWNPKVSFPSYYNKCAPLICTFEYIGRSNIFLVVMTIIGVFGGLSFSFKIPILIVLRFVEKMMNNFSRLAFQRTIKNLFICHTEHQIISRLHFILLVITLCVLYSLFATTLQSTTVQIIEPLLSTYQDLATDFSNISNSLQCSCSHISIKYQSFLTIIPRFHQICSSEFVSNGWIEYLYGEGDLVRRFVPTDFRASATGQFQLLASLCQLSQETINDSLSQLMTSDMINSQLLSSNLLDERLQTMINEFKFTTPNLLISTLNLIREMTGANMIMSILSTNWRFIPDTIINPSWKMYTEPLVYKECTCGLSWKCIQPSRGMIAGCYPIEALLQSTLQCFYDQECIDSNGIFPKLNISSLEISRFNINTTIELILNHLMVEEYSTNISYERYFNQCAPSSCTYSSVGSLSTIEVITSLIGLYGGLIIMTKCIAFMITKLWFYRKHRITPEITEQNG